MSDFAHYDTRVAVLAVRLMLHRLAEAQIGRWLVLAFLLLAEYQESNVLVALVNESR